MAELFDDLPESVPLAAQIECIKREIGMREAVYPRRIVEGRMTEALANRELARMRAVLRTLEGLNNG